MKIYLVSQYSNNGYDTFDSFVTAAETEDEARDTSPRGGLMNWEEAKKAIFSEWCSDRELVKVQLIGSAAPFTGPGVILASFNAG